MKIVVDTNVMLQAIPVNSRYYKLYNSILEEEHQLVISNEITNEYFEMFETFYREETYFQLIELFRYSQYIVKSNPHYRFRLIHHDQDDNKFVDAAICGNADFIVTSDKHFDVLKKVEFPKIKVISPQDFINLYC